MIEMHLARPEELSARKELWKLCFGDSDAFINWFFDHGPAAEDCFVLTEGDALLSSAVIFPEALVLPHGTRHRAAYVYGVCTHPDHRKQGYARALLQYVDFIMQNRGYDCAVTVPSDDALHLFYASIGYLECFTATQFTLVPTPQDGLVCVSPVTPEEYHQLRSSLLQGTLYTDCGVALLRHQLAQSALSGGGLFRVGTGCAITEYTPDGSLLVKELLPGDGTVEQAAAALAAMTSAPQCQLRIADEAGKKFGMLRWYLPGKALQWDWNSTGYLGVTLD